MKQQAALLVAAFHWGDLRPNPYPPCGKDSPQVRHACLPGQKRCPVLDLASAPKNFDQITKILVKESVGFQPGTKGYFQMSASFIPLIWNFVPLQQEVARTITTPYPSRMRNEPKTVGAEAIA